MSLLVLAYPDMKEDNFNFIQSFREKNDRHFPNFNPHFTLVFPVADIKEDIFIEHIKKSAASFRKIQFNLKCAVVVKDSFGELWDIFLIPDQGNSSIIKLHDALYKGVLITELRIDIPYIPHMNIGNDIDPFHCFNLAYELNNSNISIPGEISKLTIVNNNGINAEMIEDIPLK